MQRILQRPWRMVAAATFSLAVKLVDGIVETAAFESFGNECISPLCESGRKTYTSLHLYELDGCAVPRCAP